MSEFTTAYFCVNCDAQMSCHVRMYSHGRCRSCGFKGKYACTIVDTYERSYTTKRVKSKKWYKLYDTIAAYGERHDN